MEKKKEIRKVAKPDDKDAHPKYDMSGEDFEAQLAKEGKEVHG